MYNARNPFQRLSKCTPRAQKILLALFLFPAICLLIIRHTSDASRSPGSNDPSTQLMERMQNVTVGRGGSAISLSACVRPKLTGEQDG